MCAVSRAQALPERGDKLKIYDLFASGDDECALMRDREGHGTGNECRVYVNMHPPSTSLHLGNRNGPAAVHITSRAVVFYQQTFINSNWKWGLLHFFLFFSPPLVQKQQGRRWVIRLAQPGSHCFLMQEEIFHCRVTVLLCTRVPDLSSWLVPSTFGRGFYLCLC